MKSAMFTCVLLTSSALALHGPTAARPQAKKTRKVVAGAGGPLGGTSDQATSRAGTRPVGEAGSKLPLGVAVATTLFAAEPVLAKGGEYGLAEGRIISMAHPVMMGVCFLSSLAAGYTGLQWRRLREVGAEVAVAKSGVTSAKAALEALGEEADTTAAAARLAEAQTAAAAVAATRKELADGNFRDTHYFMGTVLLAIGIPFGIEGPVNTFMRAGKLFPGEHVYAGAAICSLWAIAAALVPQMQKGNDTARSGHIALNAVATLMFAVYSVPSGLKIAEKVIANTKFP